MKIYGKAIIVGATFTLLLCAVGWFLGRVELGRAIDREAYNRAENITELLVTFMLSEDRAPTSEKLRTWTSMSDDLRVTYLDKYGMPLVDTLSDGRSLSRQAHKEEIMRALMIGSGVAYRPSDTGRRTIYAARVITFSSGTTGIVRVDFPVKGPSTDLAPLYVLHVCGLIVATLIPIGFLLRKRRNETRFLSNLCDATRAYGAGDFSHKIPAVSSEYDAVASAMRRLSRKLEERVSSLVERNEELDILFDNLSEPIFLLDANGRVVRANEAVRSLGSDFSRDRVTGRFFLEIIRSGLVMRFLEECGRLGSSVTTFNLDDHVYKVKGRSIRDDGILLTFHDISRMARLEKMRREFVTNVSHELRTPLSGIREYVEELRADDSDPEKRAKFLKIIGAEAKRVSFIIEGLLTISGPEERSEGLEKEEFPACNLLENVESSLGLKASKRRITIHVICDESILLYAHPSLAEEAVLTLTANAIRYCDGGSVVTLSAVTKETGEVELIVSDNGPGIPLADQKRLFERFFRGRGKSGKGMGLGLAVVNHIMLAHGGEALVKSELGGGATFTLRFPH